MVTGIPEVILCLAVTALLAWPLGSHVAKVLSGEAHVLTRPLGWLERCARRALGRAADEDMTGRQYLLAVLTFNAAGILLLSVLLMLQGRLPFNPAGLPDVPLGLALNTAISFVTNTNWQAYSGESALSYLSQAAGLGVQNFLSAATGIAVMAAFARGLARAKTRGLGNFWVDLNRLVIHVLLPLALVWGTALVSQGVVQNVAAYVPATAVESGAPVTIPMGPAASQIAIKQLGSNGGGFFGVNSAHPFENPTPLSNALELIAILLIPAALPLAFGRMIGRPKHGATLFATMGVLLTLGLGAAAWAESGASAATGVPFLEGKETRFGVLPSVLWAVATTATSNGSVNAMHSSLAPLSGGVAMVNMLLGEVVFGGVGSGVYGMILFVMIAVFVAGLMVGRTPEYLGKKLDARDVKWAVAGILLPSVAVLVMTSLALTTDAGLASLAHKGPHGLSEALYAFASAANNNGSAFGGLSANTPFYNSLTGGAMLLGRYPVIAFVLTLTSQLGAKQKAPASSGMFPTEGPLFATLLAAIVVIVGALTFFPALTLGPVVEHFAMIAGRTF